MTRYVILVFAVLQAIAFASTSAAATESVPAHEQLQCTAQTTGGDYFQFTCPLPVTAIAQRFHFKANFAGGHDDTSAAMTTALDGVPLVCDAGSKTSLFAEDGNVSLECNFSVSAPAATTLILTVKLLWSHAQYQGVELLLD